MIAYRDKYLKDDVLQLVVNIKFPQKRVKTFTDDRILEEEQPKDKPRDFIVKNM